MTAYDVVIVNGDSYSALQLGHKVYSDHLQQRLNIPVFNIASVGSSNDRITRSTVEQVLTTAAQFVNPLVIVGWSFIRRIEVWYYGQNPKGLAQRHDNSNFVTLDWLLHQGLATVEQKCLINDDLFVHKQLMDFYTQVYLLSQFLQHHNCAYFFFSAAKNCELPMHCFPDLEKLQQVQAVIRDPAIFDLHDFYVMDWALSNDPQCNPTTGHLSAYGHEKFASLLLEKIQQ